MLILPYSTALRISQPPIVTYLVCFTCLVVFTLQHNAQVTQLLWYSPQSWNPLTMITSSLAHDGWFHLFGNLIFFLAFAPALEILIGNKLRYLWIMLFISFVVGIAYSVSFLIGSSQPLPTLGLSGVVMGIIGLSAFLMPHARIRVFCWFIVFWKTFYIPAWILAVIYIGLDSWVMITADNYHGINVVAHVAGGLAGYAYGFFWMKERREETREELEEEIEAMKMERQHGETRAQAHRYNKVIDQHRLEKQQIRDFDKLMGRVYQCVKTHRDAEAINILLDEYDLTTPVNDLEDVFRRIQEWGPSRTLLCFGRMISHVLDEEKRYGRCLVYIEKCQSISPQFVLSDLSKTLFYARFAIETGKLEVAKNILVDSDERYGERVNTDQCRQLLQSILKNEIDIIL
ncbi:MAG: rhomboid family intramembrane serine protease [Gammaproteobacteria bacterium]|nr:rhomboid family intramembrane serine protease [Gammaproteobacteria bacterium]